MLFRIDLAIQCLLYIPVNFVISFSRSEKNVVDILVEIASNIYIFVDTNSSNPQAWKILTFFPVF